MIGYQFFAYVAKPINSGKFNLWIKMRSMAEGQPYFMILLILSVGLNFVIPIMTVIHAPYTYFGIMIIGFGVVMDLWSSSLFLRSKTTVSPYGSPTSLVTSGPFRISRNPMYLGMANVQDVAYHLIAEMSRATP